MAAGLRNRETGNQETIQEAIVVIQTRADGGWTTRVVVEDAVRRNELGSLDGLDVL